MGTIKPEQLWGLCLSLDLSTHDPYDVWKTKIGAKIKLAYYRGGVIQKGIAGALSVADIFLNNRLRLGYQKQEYAIVRALASQILDRKYKLSGESLYLDYAQQHINWLLNNHLKSTHGIGWGLDFEHPVSANIVYSKTTPFSTITPYVLEALISHETVTVQNGEYRNVCRSIYNFFQKDIKVLEGNSEFEVTSYGPFLDRRVANSVSYTMYSLILLDRYFDYSLNTFKRASRLFNYLKRLQQEDGSWYYSDEGNSFIDCFHSCIILKNLIKSKLNGAKFDGIDEVINKGYTFLKKELWDEEQGIYKRFAKTNKPGLIKFDLYDNAEMLQCAVLMNDLEEARRINASITKNFIKNDTIYSSIDVFGKKQNPRMLRWAILPYLYSLNLFETYGQ